MAAPSCQPGGPGQTNCSEGMGITLSCCTSFEVPGGTFYRKYTNSGNGPMDEANPATVSGFRLDEFEVTVGRFRQFANAWSGGWRPAPGSGKHTYLNGGQGLLAAGNDAGVEYEAGWVASYDTSVSVTRIALGAGADFSTWTTSPGPNESLPIDTIDWYDAYAFCIWDGGFLPSEAEWEYAAAGGDEQRQYPWGSTDPGTSNEYAIYGCYYGPECQGAGPSVAPVGTAVLGIGRWGQLDLGGNLDEPTLDYYSDVFVDPCVNCAQLSPNADPGAAFPEPMFHGGDFFNPGSNLLPVERNPAEAGAAKVMGGIRCARAP